MGHHKHSYSMKNFIHDAGAVTKPLHKDVQSLVKGANKDLNKVVDFNAGIMNNAIKTSGSTLSSLGLPFMIVAAAVGIYYVTKK